MINRRHQAGISMIELLITLAIFTIGLAGFATLQMRSLQESFDTSQRSVAIWRAQELADRIRSNAGQLDTYLDEVNDANVCGAAPTRCADYWSGSAEVAATACTATEVAAFDAWDVLCNGPDATDAALVESDISLDCEDIDATDAAACTAGSALTIDICWTSRSATGDSQIETVAAGDVPTDCANSDLSYLFEYYTLEFRP